LSFKFEMPRFYSSLSNTIWSTQP